MNPSTCLDAASPATSATSTPSVPSLIRADICHVWDSLGACSMCSMKL